MHICYFGYYESSLWIEHIVLYKAHPAVFKRVNLSFMKHTKTYEDKFIKCSIGVSPPLFSTAGALTAAADKVAPI